MQQREHVGRADLNRSSITQGCTAVVHHHTIPNLALVRIASLLRSSRRTSARHAMSTIDTTLWDGSSELDVAAAARSLRRGELVAFPTETVYGLGADATNEAAVSAVFTAKGRPSDNPLIVHVASASALRMLAASPLPEPAARLAEALWPGPLTLVVSLRHDAGLANSVTAGLNTVGVRVPRHPVAAALLAAADIPVAAPSANTSGRPSPTTAAHVLADLDGRISGVLDGGPAPPHAVGVESTVVDATRSDQLIVLRPGALGRATLAAVARVPVLDGARTVERPRAPGMKYRHYAPRAPLRVVSRDVLLEAVRNELALAPGIVGVLADVQMCARLDGEQRVRAVPCGVRGDALSAAQALYGALRAFDGEGDDAREVRVILAAELEDVGDGVAGAVMNRLRKAASGGHVGKGRVNEERVLCSAVCIADTQEVG